MDLKALYTDLCAQRDAVNAKNAPIETELEKANAECEKWRVKAAELAAKIDDNRGREKWIELKKQIGQLAPAMSRARRDAVVAPTGN
jgi:hypothetical protein